LFTVGATPLSFDKVHRVAGEPLAAGLPRVVLRLLDGGPSKDCHELMRGRAILRGDGGAGLAQTVSRAVIEAGFVAPLSEPVPEPVGRKRSAKGRDKESEISGRRRSYRGRQVR
jgi:hypothetical protein